MAEKHLVMDSSAPCEEGGPQVLCVGQSVVDCITKNSRESAGRKVADSITLNVGGDAVNESIALTGMGHCAALMCCVGSDHAGKIILDEARRHGVNTDHVTVSPDLVTPVANIFVREDGSRYSVSSTASLVPGYVPDLAAALKSLGAVGSGSGVKVVSFASLFRAPLDDPAVIRKLIREAHESGAIVCADTKLPTFRRTELSEIADVLPFIDYFFPNEEEALYYTDMDEPRDAVTELLSMGVKGVIVKCGAKGIVAGQGW